MFEAHAVVLPWLRAWAKAGRRMLMRMAMIAMTTSSSMSVKALWLARPYREHRRKLDPLCVIAHPRADMPPGSDQGPPLVEPPRTSPDRRLRIRRLRPSQDHSG